MTTIVPEGVSPTGERIVREIEGVGTLVFENYGPGEWMTQKGEPAKKSRRRYLLNGDELDSVSSIVGTLDKPALAYWIEDQATRGAVKAERLGELAGVHEDDWMRRVRALDLGASAKRDESADRGTVIHSAMHGLATEGKPPNPASLPAPARPWLQGAVRAWMAMDPELIEAEQLVCFPKHGFAGRFDLLARVDGAVCLLDYKSGKGKAYDSAHFSTRLYAMAAAVTLGIEVERIIIVAIADDGSFELVDCAASEADALALLHTFRSRKRINSDMAAQRRIARAAA